MKYVEQLIFYIGTTYFLSKKLSTLNYKTITGIDNLT